MEYIAIGIKSNELSTCLPELERLAKAYDITLVANDGLAQIDSEIESGVNAFSQKFELTAVQVFRSSTYQKFATSSDISQDLSGLYMTATKSFFLSFMYAAKQYLPANFYMLFAFEWHKKDKIRFLDMDLSELEVFFRNNNGWHFWLYDYMNGVYFPDLDVSLVLKISN